MASCALSIAEGESSTSRTLLAASAAEATAKVVAWSWASVTTR